MKTVIELAREAEDKVIANPDLDWKREFAELVRADEREECLNCYSPDDTATDWADKIRARSNT